MANTSGYYCYIAGRDIAEYIQEISWEDNDLDAPKSGRDLGGMMHRGRVGDKWKLQFKLVPIRAAELNPIISSIRTQYVSVSTNMVPGDPSYTGYNSNRKGGVSVICTDGVLRHKDVSFNVIER